MARRKGRSLTRQDVVNAAVACLDSEGEGALGVNRVARELGIKPPSIYNHVQGNDDLRKAVAIEGWRQVLEHHRSQREVKDHVARFKMVCREFRTFALAHPAFFAVTVSTKLDAETDEVAPVWEEMFMLFGQALTSFRVSEAEILPAAHYVRASVQGFINMEMNHQIPEEMLESCFEWMLDRMVAGFSIPGVTPQA